MVSTPEYWKYGLWKYEGFVLLFYIFVSKKMIPSFEPINFVHYSMHIHIIYLCISSGLKPRTILKHSHIQLLKL